MAGSSQLEEKGGLVTNTRPISIHPKCKRVNSLLHSPPTPGPRVEVSNLSPLPGSHSQTRQPGMANLDPEGYVQLPLCQYAELFELVVGAQDLCVGHGTCMAPTEAASTDLGRLLFVPKASHGW